MDLNLNKNELINIGLKDALNIINRLTTGNLSHNIVQLKYIIDSLIKINNDEI